MRIPEKSTRFAGAMDRSPNCFTAVVHISDIRIRVTETTPMTQRRKTTTALHRAILGILMVLTFSSISQAGPLGVNINPFPVIQVAFITSSYDLATGVFAADGFMRTLDEGAGRVSYPNPKFSLSANLNTMNGSFSIDGGLLNSSVLKGFAYVPGTLEFLFGPASGSLVDNGSFDATEPIDIMFSGTATALPTSFTSNFQSTTFSSALIREDPEPKEVPEPSTLILTLVAAGGATIRRFRSRRA